MATDSLRTLPHTSNTLDHSQHSLKQFWKSHFVSVITSCGRNTVNAAAKCHSAVGQARKSMLVCPHPPQSVGLARCNFSLFPKVAVIMKSKYSESVRIIKATTAVQLKTGERASRIPSQSDKDRISVFKVRERIQRQVNGNVSLTVIVFSHTTWCLSDSAHAFPCHGASTPLTCGTLQALALKIQFRCNFQLCLYKID